MIHLCLWLCVALCVSGATASELSYQEDLLNYFIPDQEREALEKYRDPRKPQVCIDVCQYQATDGNFGSYFWQNTSVGYRRFVRCQYPDWDPKAFSYRDCLLGDNGKAYWSSNINYTDCRILIIPGYRQFFSAVEVTQGEPGHVMWLLRSFVSLLEVFTGGEFDNFALKFYEEDAMFIYSIAYNIINDYDSLHDQIHFLDLIQYLGFMLKEDFVPFFKNNSQLLFHFTSIFNAMPQVVSKYGPVPSWEVSVSGELAYSSDTITNTTFLLHLGMGWVVNVLPCEDCTYTIKSLFVDSPVFTEIEDLLQTTSKSTLDSTSDASEGRIEYLYGKLAYLSAFDFNGSSSLGYPRVEIEYNTKYPFKFKNQRCAWNVETKGYYDMGQWRTSDGPSPECEITANNSLETVLVTKGTGYFGFMSKFRENYERHSSVVNASTPPPGLEVFLGFPYKYELWLLGVILQSISFVCLLATICTCIVFRKARQGRVTALLLNLCCSIVCLDIVLFAAEMTTNSRVGCMVSNILRYYFITASLLWNGVEAYNMHLMLLKVFDQGVSSFVAKAAVVSWGMPILLIGLVIIVDAEAFSGLYVDCVFRCILKEKVLFYAYLLPLCLIMLHNFVVFGFVMRILCSTRGLPDNPDRKQVPTWRQVAGGVALLALLGLPWIFSAFGAIDATKANQHLKRTEAIFQVVFLVGVNLQGVFIFIFHCLRNSDVRGQWKKKLYGTSSMTSRRNTTISTVPPLQDNI